MTRLVMDWGMELFQVDAFTTELFRGNPAGVCLLDRSRDEPWMQAVAAEMNLAETAFLEARAQGRFGLRWFTPTMEVPLCGHATLASAHVLWQEAPAFGARGVEATTSRLKFETKSGMLTAERAGEDIVLDFPADPPTEEDLVDGELADALGTRLRWRGRSRLYQLVEVDDEDSVRSLRPDLSAVAAVVDHGVIVTARADAGSDYDFVSRMFAPASGIDEDPVTGSSHCVLGPYWSARLGSLRLRGYQASPRGGTVTVTLQGDRVRLGGRAVTFLRGSID